MITPTPNHNPAASHDFGAMCFASGEDVSDHYGFDNLTIDTPTAQLGFERAAHAWEQDCIERFAS